MDQSWEYINRSQTHECGNWDLGRAIPFLGIHKWDFVAVDDKQKMPRSFLKWPKHEIFDSSVCVQSQPVWVEKGLKFAILYF